jgi:hypothetical protein
MKVYEVTLEIANWHNNGVVNCIRQFRKFGIGLKAAKGIFDSILWDGSRDYTEMVWTVTAEQLGDYYATQEMAKPMEADTGLWVQQVVLIEPCGKQRVNIVD